MIISEIIKIKYTNNNTVIENELKKLNINPLRWAVVGVKSNELILSVSYDCNIS